MLLTHTKQLVASAVGIFLISTNIASAAAPTEIAAVGPVESANCTARTFKVLGVTFQAAKRSLLSQVCSAANDGTAFRYVVVVGTKAESGDAIALKVSELSSASYVPGASPVFLRGPVSLVRSSVGDFEVLGSRVVGVPAELPTSGALIEVVGTQPQLAGVIVATKIVAADSNLISDSNIADAISGSGVNSIAISGSGVDSKIAISGSGKNSTAISGSGADSKIAISGSGVNSTAISGSGVDSKIAISGSGVNSTAISGSGVESKIAISGSGVNSTAISGSGVDSKIAISGSGVNSTAISGSGVDSKIAISGSGVNSTAISGSGVN